MTRIKVTRRRMAESMVRVVVGSSARLKTPMAMQESRERASPRMVRKREVS